MKRRGFLGMVMGLVVAPFAAARVATAAPTLSPQMCLTIGGAETSVIRAGYGGWELQQEMTRRMKQVAMEVITEQSRHGGSLLLRRP